MRLVGLTPTEFTLLFAMAGLLAIIFYLLSFRRRTAVMAADPIWRRVIGRRRTPFRKLLALLGQILILFLLSLALADPRIRPAGVSPPVAAVVVVDVSASMGTIESDGSRLDEAKALISIIADAMGPRDRIMLMAMDDSARPLTSFVGEAQSLKQAAMLLEPSAMADNRPAAMLFATSALSGALAAANRKLPDAGFPEDAVRRVVFISDRFHDLQVPDDIELVQMAVGRATENLALTAFDVRRRGGAARGSEMFVEVTNYGLRSRRTRLSIHTPEALLGEEVLSIPAGQSVSRNYFMKPLPGERVLATLTAPRGEGSADAFALDDRAYARIPRRESRRVLLVSDGNLFLSKALALNPSISLTRVATRDFRPGMLSGALAAVFDGVCPPSTIPAAYFNPPRSADCPFELGKQVEFPELLPLRGDHPVTDGLTLVDVQVKTAHRLIPVPGDVELLSDAHGPLMIARQENGNKVLGVGFDVTTTDLPLRIAFPIWLHNTLGWFLGQDDDTGFEERSTGRLIELPGWAGAETEIVTPQKGRTRPKRIGANWVLRPNTPGFYSAAGRSQRSRKHWLVPVNFYQPGESDLVGDRRVTGTRLRWRSQEPEDSLGAVLAGFDKTEHSEPPLQWPLLLLAAVWLMLFDWVFFCFRILY